jgi:diaminohydroxyphosphoribosylaminopyrimidine deaminase / 5-amino-6-(5-phosphoribosylamino)uracil reductase
MASDLHFMELALRLARRAYGATSPNPMVGAMLVKRGQIIGQGWHHRAGEPHAEIEALRAAQRRGNDPRGATLYVTLEPCCTHGRTPPCTEAIIAAGIRRVVIGAIDPNPRHRGKALALLKRAGIAVHHGVLEEDCQRLNEPFNHWIVHGTPWVTVKSAMTLDGKIATATGDSKWITSERSRAYSMTLRQGADAILVGINTILADNPELTFRTTPGKRQARARSAPIPESGKRLRRIILDSHARTPLDSKVVSDSQADLTTIVVSRAAPSRRVAQLENRVSVLVAPSRPLGKAPGEAPRHGLDLCWLLRQLGKQQVLNLLVEGGGEVNASFLMQGLAHRVAFFYAPLVFGGSDARKAVAGEGATRIEGTLDLAEVRWRRLGPDWLLTGKVERSLAALEPP